MSTKSWKNKFGIVKNGVLKQFTVYRGSWLNAATRRMGNRTMLLDPHGRRCCIGFMASACKVPEYRLLRTMSVRKLDPESKALCFDASDWRHSSDTDMKNDPFYEAYGFNDWDEPARAEEKIAAWFKCVFGVTVRFVDGETPKR